MELGLSLLRALRTKSTWRHENDQPVAQIAQLEPSPELSLPLETDQVPKNIPAEVEVESRVRLPYELLLLIVSYVKSQGTLFSLCRSSHALYNIAIPALYKSVTIQPLYRNRTRIPTEPAVHLFYHTIQSQGLINRVTQFQIQLHRCNSGGGCKCDSFDSLVGQVLMSLENLEFLDFTCNLCCFKARHPYLKSLKTRRLKRFTLQCGCFYYESATDGLRQVLTSPSMGSVKELRFKPTWPTLELKEPLPKDSLPELVTFEFPTPLGDSVLCRSILSKRTLTRLVGDGVNLSTIPDILRQYPAKWSHLSMHNNSPRIPDSIELDPLPYLNLQHLGSISLMIDELDSQHIHKVFSSLSILSNLLSLEIHIYQLFGKLYTNQLSEYLLDSNVARHIGQCLPSLAKIYVVAFPPIPDFDIKSGYSIWERWNGKWRGERVEEFERWDIVNGVI